MDWGTYKNRILAELDSRAFFMSELENIEVRGSEAKASCPFAAKRHEGGHDNNPSFSVNLERGTYYCPVCLSKGNVHTFLKDKHELTSDKAWFTLGDGLGIDRPEGSAPLRPDINPGLAGLYHRQLMEQTGPIRQVLRERRGLSDKTLVDMQLGWDGERITIPIYDEHNTLVNIRRYKWDAPEGVMKLLNYADDFGNKYGELRIFGLENLLDDNITEIIWSEGETDRMVAEQYGFPTACPTSGAGSWKNEWVRLFRNKKVVYVVQDNDEAGRNATAKICDRLKDVTEVRTINWPKDFPKKGDITDYFVEFKHTREDFAKLLKESTLYTGKSAIIGEESDKEAIFTHLADSSNASLYGKRLKVPVLVSGKDTSPYICPKSIDLTCECDLENKRCSRCSAAVYGGSHAYEVLPTDKNIMKLIKCSEESQIMALKEAFGINKNCKVAKLEISNYMNVEEVRLIPKAEADVVVSKEKEYVVRTGLIVDKNIKTNKRYTLLGSMYPEPNTQQAYYVFDKALPDKDLASDFELNDEVRETLKIFMPKEGQAIEDKINEIHMDLERNITRVWERRDVAIAVDLVYNSVLSFYFQGSFVKRGWVELMIIGDSGQAKTTLVERIMQHYRLGDIVSGEASSRTGLIYNLQQTNKRWMLQWGALPLNDAGLLCIDEMSGLNEDDLAKMSDVRTSGVAKCTGVITSETNARTRAIYISNPRNGKQLNTETYGCTTVLKLWGKAEDVRRLDLAMAVASGDVDARLINRKISEMEEIPHVYNSDACNLRTLWVWSRRPDDVIVEDEAMDEILKQATAMGMQYSSKIPIVEAADQRLKLTRLSISCAAMLVSTDETMTKVVVKKEHVEFVVKFMHKIYSYKSFGYDKFSAQERTNSDASPEMLANLRKGFMMLPVSDPNELARILYQLPYMDRYTLSDYTGLERTDLQSVLKFLTINHIVERFKSEYRRLPLGTTLLDNIISNPITRSEKNQVMQEVYGDPEY